MCDNKWGLAFFGALTPVGALFAFFGGSMRKVDSLGRIVIPKELRKKYGLFEGSDITFEENGRGVLVRAAGDICLLCSNKIKENSTLPLCDRCIAAVKEYNNI